MLARVSWTFITAPHPGQPPAAVPAWSRFCPAQSPACHCGGDGDGDGEDDADDVWGMVTGILTRAANEPSAKFYNHGEGLIAL